MRDFSIAIDIEASPHEVWAVMSDVERWHEWTTSITRVVRLDAGPFSVGSRSRVRQPGLPPAVWQVTEVQADTGFTWVSRGPGLRVAGRHWITPRPTGSRATLALHYGGALGSLLARLLRSMNDRFLQLEATGLKRRSEELAHSSSGIPSGS
jgi:uncharacterized membrane protein